MLLQKIQERLTIKENEKQRFKEFGKDYWIDGDLFIKDNTRYSYVIRMNKDNKIEYVLKEGRKHILVSKSSEVIMNKIARIIDNK